MSSLKLAILFSNIQDDVHANTSLIAFPGEIIDPQQLVGNKKSKGIAEFMRGRVSIITFMKEFSGYVIPKDSMFPSWHNLEKQTLPMDQEGIQKLSGMLFDMQISVYLKEKDEPPVLKFIVNPK